MRVVLNGVVGEFTPLPGCHQCVVSHDVFVPEGQRGLGHGKEAHALRLDHMRALGYDYALCTIRSDNTRQVNIVDKARWTWLSSFHSSKTGNDVRLYGRRLYV